MVAAPVAPEIDAAVWGVVENTARLTWRAHKKYFMLFPLTVEGSFSRIEGDIVFHSESPTSADVALRIPVSSHSSGNGQRDKHMSGPDFFDSEQHPDITFTSEHIHAVGNDPHAYHVHGILTVRGNARPIALSGTFVPGTDRRRAHVTLTGEIDRRDFGITWKKEPFIWLGNEITLAIDVDLEYRGN